MLLEFVIGEEIVVVVCNGEVDVVFVDKDFLMLFVEVLGGELMMVGDFVLLGGGVGIGMCEIDVEL